MCQWRPLYIVVEFGTTCINMILLVIVRVSLPSYGCMNFLLTVELHSSFLFYFILKITL